MEFEWNEAKAESNLRKHGVAFEVARAALLDEYALILADESAEPDETRWKLIGLAGGRELVVVYPVRGGTIRLISARKAVRHERDQYWQDRSL